MKTQKEQHKLKALVRDLERELSQGKTQLEALAEIHERLQQAERICHELNDENRCLREENAEWQKRCTSNEADQKEISALQQQLDLLRIEHDALLQTNSRMQEQLNLQSERDGLVMHESVENPAFVPSPELIQSASAPDNKNDASAKAPKEEIKLGWLFPSLDIQKWHFAAIFACVGIVLAIAGMSKILGTESPSSTAPTRTETAAIEESATPASPRPSIAPAPRLRGTFQTVRPAQVFSEPTENSALVASIGKGVRLTVVDSREGWLEVRSKHGRPPGFIRKEEAVKVGSN